MKKRIVSVIAVCMLLLLTATSFTGCVKLSKAEEAVVGKYVLVELSIVGYPYVNASTYEYFTLDFKPNKKCTIFSKAGITAYSATASWQVNKNGEVEVITKKGFAKAVETYTFENDTLFGTNTSVVEGQNLTATMKFEKVVTDPA